MTRDLMYCRAILKKVSFDPELFERAAKGVSIVKSKRPTRIECLG